MKKSDLTQSLKLLSQSFAVSGYEWELGMAKKIEELVGSSGQRIGDNLVYRIGSSGKKVLITAHMDEVGFFVTRKNKEYISLVPIGDVSVLDVIGHVLTFFSGGKASKSDRILRAGSFPKLRVTGVSAEIGDVGTFERGFLVKEDVVVAPALDNKVGCLALIETLKSFQDKKIRDSIYFCFSCREEVAVNGLMSAVKEINPDLCIDVDSAYAGPLKDVGNWAIPTIGRGPALQLMGKDFVIRSSNRRLIESIAEKKAIPIQYEIPDSYNGGTNTSTLINHGYDVIQLNIPVAFQHTAKSKASLKDIRNMIWLLENLLGYVAN